MNSPLALLLVTIVSSFGALLLYCFWRILTHPYERRQQERVIVGVVGNLIEQALPLGTALSVAARSEAGEVGRRLERIAQLLRSGQPLSAALRAGFPACSGQTVALIAAGESAGRLREATQQAEAALVNEEERRQNLASGIPPYVLVVVACTLAAAFFVVVVIVPKYEEILRDADAPMPFATRVFVRICLTLWQSAPLALGGLAIISALALYLRLQARRPDRMGVFTRAADAIRWRAPGLRRIEMTGGMAQMFDFLRYTLTTGMPMPDAARLTGSLDVNLALRRRMHRFADLVAAGQSTGIAARAADLGEVASVALSTRSGAGLDAALRFAADYYRALHSRSWLIVRTIALPATVMTLGLLVGGLVYAMFVPLIALINAAMIW